MDEGEFGEICLDVSLYLNNEEIGSLLSDVLYSKLKYKFTVHFFNRQWCLTVEGMLSGCVSYFHEKILVTPIDATQSLAV